MDSIFKFAKEQNIGVFPSRLVSKWEKSPKNPNKLPSTPATKQKPANEDGHYGKSTIDAFDPLPISGIHNLFDAITSYGLDKWKILASKAKSNGLDIARTETSKGSGESTFNPVLVANWLISKKGVSAEKLERKLKKCLPARSRDHSEDIFGFE